MPLTKLTQDVNNVQGLADLTQNQATTVKQTFDKAGNDIKTYINDVLTPEIDTTLATKAELVGLAVGVVPEGSVTDTYLSDGATDIKARLLSHTHNGTNSSLIPPTSISPQGSGSGLDADLLDGKHGSFFSDAIQRNAYDIYDIWIEGYYQGWFGGPQTTNVKGIFLDGFKDLTNIPTGVDVGNCAVLSASTQRKVTFATGVEGGNGGLFSGDMDSTSKKTVFRFKVQDRSIKCTGVKASFYRDNANSYTIRAELYSLNASGDPTGATLRQADLATTNGGFKDITWAEITLTPGDYSVVFTIISARNGYTAIFNCSDGSYDSPATIAANLYAPLFVTGAYTSPGLTVLTSGNPLNCRLLGASDTTTGGSFKTKSVALGFTPTQAKLWITGTSDFWSPDVSLDGGTTFVNANAVTSRADRREAGMTEYEFSFPTLTAGSSLVVRIRGSYGLIIKRFGVHLM